VIAANASDVIGVQQADLGDGPDGPMGLLAKDGRKRKPYYAFKTMSEQLGEYTLVRQVAGVTHPTKGVQARLRHSGHRTET
jgi:hypothetical protein